VDFTSVSWYEPTEWHWVFGDGSAGSTERNPAHTFPAPGPYDVCLTVSNANGSDTKCKTVWVGTSSTSDEPGADESGIRLYPNPATNMVIIQGAPEDAVVNITDYLGRLIHSGKLQSNRIELTTLQNGVYTVQVFSSEKTLLTTQKLVIAN
jgi:PKD repeat protein